MRSAPAAGGLAAQEAFEFAGLTVTVAEEPRSRTATSWASWWIGSAPGSNGAVLVLFGRAGRGAVHVALSDDLVQRGLKSGDLAQPDRRDQRREGRRAPAFRLGGSGGHRQAGRGPGAGAPPGKPWLGG